MAHQQQRTRQLLQRGGLTLFLLVLLAAMPKAAFTQTIDESDLYTSDFETGAIQCDSCNPDGWVQSKSASDAIIVQTAPTLTIPPRQGTHVVRIHADKNDPWTASPRAELAGWAHTFFQLRTEYWVGWSIYLPADGGYEFDIQPEMLMQIHDRPDPCDTVGPGPSTALRAENGNWVWVVRSHAERCIHAHTPENEEFINIGPQERGRWTDFVARYYFSWHNDGIVQVWKDGALVVDKVNVPNYYKNQKGPYPKFGLYKWDWLKEPSNVTTRTIYFDAIKIYKGQNGYNIVAP